MSNVTAVLGVALLLCTGCASVDGTGQATDPYLAVLDAALACQRTNGADCHAMDRIFDLKRTAAEPNRLLVELLDYRLGAASGETLADFITRAGADTAPLLERKRTVPLQCQPKYAPLCRPDVADRNQEIDQLLDAIKRGAVLESAD